MLTRREIEERLAILKAEEPLYPNGERKREALETAKQLADWLDRCQNCEPCPFEYGCLTKAWLEARDE